MSSILLITLNTYELPNIRCIKSFKNIDWAGVDCLIFHSTKDSELEAVLELTQIKETVGKVIYINKNINPLYYCIFTGMNADIYDIEDYLMNEETLMFLVDNYKTTGMTVKSPNSDIETLAKCIAALSDSSPDSIHKMVSNTFWVRTLNTAVSNVDIALSRASKINIDIVDMLGETKSLIGSLEMGQESTTRELEKLKSLIAEMDRKEKPNTPFIYSTYSVPTTVRNVLYIKAVGNCRYLNSFILAYQHYLRMKKQLTSKIIFVYPKLKTLMKRYENITRLAMDSIDLVDLGSNNVYVTFEPKNAVMDAFFNQYKVDLFIVVDLMFGDDLVKGYMVKTLYAASGTTDIEKFKLKTEDTILSLIKYQQSITIKHIPKYVGSNESTKRALYFKYCSDSFEVIDNKVF